MTPWEGEKRGEVIAEKDPSRDDGCQRSAITPQPTISDRRI
jgi:hypothetical protein